ncbi:MAG: hypothetical protein C0610_16640 [Desulfobacteraceae bacterium]|nr:MAG: hypothetical protein C0610_16640 [Desulfobacteraceae bacterium]
MKWNETFNTVVVSTAHLPEYLAKMMEDECDRPYVYEKTAYGYRIWAKSDVSWLPKEIKPIIVRARKGGYRWVEFDMDADEQEEFQTWEW